MIKASTDKKWLPLYEALASDVRLDIINLLATETLNNKDIAARLGISSAIVTFHLKKLHAAGIIQSEHVRIDGGTHKLNKLSASGVNIAFPAQQHEKRQCHEVHLKVGHYTQFEIYPTCGLASTDTIIGHFDDPRFFYDPERVNANIIWFGMGYVEYQIPNYLLSSQRIKEIEFSLEIGSEAPGVAANWPSDISFTLNDTWIGYWTSPGDSGHGRGTYTPIWWPDDINQYGSLKIVKINNQGAFVDGELISEVTLADLTIERNSWTLRIGVDKNADNVGGVTIYGAGFGNYNQDIIFRTYYTTDD